jgi:hypothetical protein
MAIEGSGIISLGTAAGTNRSISGEFGDPNDDGTFTLNEYQTFLGQSPDAQISFSDFYGLSNVVHSTTMVAGYQSQQYATLSGYGNSTTGDSLGDDSVDSICGQTNATITSLFNINGSLNFGLTKSGATFSNSGWTTMKVWVGQNNNSGTPTATFPRTGTGSYHSGSTNFSSSSGSCTYLWTGVQMANAFGTTHQGNCFIEWV